MISLNISYVDGLPDAEMHMLQELQALLNDKASGNARRMEYYQGKNRLKDLGISIPQCIKGLNGTIGWAAKAVDALAVRSRFDGFSFVDGQTHGLDEIFNGNAFKAKYQQSVTSELINSCAFITVSKGGADEPPVIVNTYSALNASAVWDFRRNRIKYGLVIVDKQKRYITSTEEDMEVTAVNLYTNTDVWEIDKVGESWQAQRLPHIMGRPLMECLVYRPTLDRPFGRSRISRAAMEVIDNATRESVRTEIHSEFFTSPQRVILGVDPNDVFSGKSEQQALIGSFLALGRDEEGEVPQVTQFAQASMQPHLDYMRSLASRFSAITNVPLAEMGVVTDNPSSAEAIAASKEALVIEAEDLNALNGEALKTIGKMAMAILQNKPLTKLTDAEKTIMPRFKNPSTPSIVTQADAMVKLASAASSESWLPKTQVFWEEVGFPEEKVDRVLNGQVEQERKQTLTVISNALKPTSEDDSEQ